MIFKRKRDPEEVQERYGEKHPIPYVRRKNWEPDVLEDYWDDDREHDRPSSTDKFY